jgi:hypothetical protein
MLGAAINTLIVISTTFSFPSSIPSYSPDFSPSPSLSLTHTDTLTETRYLSQLCLSNLDPSLALAFPESTMVTHLLPLLGELLHVLLVHSLLEHLLHCG